jgi:hypothetical protein
MAQFTGRLEGSGIEPSRVLIHIGGGQLRISAGRLEIGSWSLADIEAGRDTIYKFTLNLAGHGFQFFPDDPSAFSEQVGAVIDLTEAGRFGLKARIEEASVEEANAG